MNFDPVPFDPPVSPWAVAGILIVLAALVAGAAFTAWKVIRKW